MLFESALYPSHVREILFLGSCLIHDFPSTEAGSVESRVKSTLHSPFHPFIAGKMQGTVYAVSHRCFQFSRVHSEDSLSAMRQFFMIQWTKRTVDKISFRYACSAVAKPPYVSFSLSLSSLSPSTMNCCCSFVAT